MNEIDREATMQRSRLAIIGLILIAAVVVIGAFFEQSPYDQPYARIEPGLWLGRAVTVPPRGVSAAVNVCGYADPYTVDAQLYEPILDDGGEPTIEWLDRCVRFIAEQRSQGREVYVHCLTGVNRSSAVVAAYLMSEHAWSRERAISEIRKARPIIDPNPQLIRVIDEWSQQRQP